MLTILQCGKCKYKLEWVITDDLEDSYYKCQKYPNKIPTYVEEATEECPKFEEKG